tara:strand:- start:185 stop:1438 length:1254 start_codon:yes stop_codon:yes gene_type:complete
MKKLANLLKDQGRFGDTDLIHVTPKEIQNLEASLGGELPRNPKTGLKEANPFAVFAALAALTAGSAAYSAKQSRKAQRKAREDQRFRELIEGSAPNISNVQEVIPEEIQGSEVAGLEAALRAMDYEGGQPPIPGQDDAMGAMPTDLSEEELIELIESGGLEGLLPQMAADGGPVGTPNDVYYFGVPQIMGMMQDPDPQIQQVGMQLAGQMEAMPEASMVPATMDQIRTMAYGGAVEPKKFETGGTPEYDQNLDANFLYRQGLMQQLSDLNKLVEEGVIGQTTADQDRQTLIAELTRNLNPDSLNLKEFVEKQFRDNETDMQRQRIDRTLFKELSETRVQELLENLKSLDDEAVRDYEGVVDESEIPLEQLAGKGYNLTSAERGLGELMAASDAESGRTLSEKDIENRIRALRAVNAN